MYKNVLMIFKCVCIYFIFPIKNENYMIFISNIKQIDVKTIFINT